MDDIISVLIVDDDQNFRKILKLKLKAKFKNVEFVEADSLSSARQALQKLIKLDLILLDQHLPDGIGAELLSEQNLTNVAVLAMSSDDAPELPAETVLKGARFFLPKSQVREAFFLPLVTALIERTRLEKEIEEAKRNSEILSSIRTLLKTLQHEINNPLGAVFGATYLIKSGKGSDQDNKEALGLIDQSSKRIKHVLDQLCETAELEVVKKGEDSLYQVPGDPNWDKN